MCILKPSRDREGAILPLSILLACENYMAFVLKLLQLTPPGNAKLISVTWVNDNA